MLVLLLFCTFNFFFTHGCASRQSGVLNNFLSCKRHEVTYLLRTNALRLFVSAVRREQIRLSFMQTLLYKVNKSVCYLPLPRKFFCFGFYRFVEFFVVILVFCNQANKNTSCDNAFNIITKGF